VLVGYALRVDPLRLAWKRHLYSPGATRKTRLKVLRMASQFRKPHVVATDSRLALLSCKRRRAAFARKLSTNFAEIDHHSALRDNKRDRNLAVSRRGQRVLDSRVVACGGFCRLNEPERIDAAFAVEENAASNPAAADPPTNSLRFILHAQCSVLRVCF
jgi:hypothetical protein